jgi:hypothetical protein
MPFLESTLGMGDFPFQLIAYHSDRGREQRDPGAPSANRHRICRLAESAADIYWTLLARAGSNSW